MNTETIIQYVNCLSILKNMHYSIFLINEKLAYHLERIETGYSSFKNLPKFSNFFITIFMFFMFFFKAFITRLVKYQNKDIFKDSYIEGREYNILLTIITFIAFNFTYNSLEFDNYNIPKLYEDDKYNSKAIMNANSAYFNKSISTNNIKSDLNMNFKNMPKHSESSKNYTLNSINNNYKLVNVKSTDNNNNSNNNIFIYKRTTSILITNNTGNYYTKMLIDLINTYKYFFFFIRFELLHYDAFEFVESEVKQLNIIALFPLISYFLVDFVLCNTTSTCSKIFTYIINSKVRKELRASIKKRFKIFFIVFCCYYVLFYKEFFKYIVSNTLEYLKRKDNILNYITQENLDFNSFFISNNDISIMKEFSFFLIIYVLFRIEQKF